MPHRLHVYLIDDNVTDLELAHEAFSGHVDEVRLTTCFSAESALKSLMDPSTLLPDVIVTDLNMPLMSGLELLKVLKGEPKLQCIPVVMLTTSSDADDVKSAYTLHASSYLVKAATFSTFMTQVDAFVTFWMTTRRVHQA